MHQSRPYLKKEYRLSDLHKEIDIPQVPDDTRSMHTLFATLMNDVDRRADICQSIKQEIIIGLAQAWLHFAENYDGNEVYVTQHSHGVKTTVSNPENDRPLSSYHPSSLSDQHLNYEIKKRAPTEISETEFINDMQSLDTLRRNCYQENGLDNDQKGTLYNLLSKYDIDRGDWWGRRYLAENQNTTRAQSQTQATVSSQD